MLEKQTCSYKTMNVYGVIVYKVCDSTGIAVLQSLKQYIYVLYTISFLTVFLKV